MHSETVLKVTCDLQVINGAGQTDKSDKAPFRSRGKGTIEVEELWAF